MTFFGGLILPIPSFSSHDLSKSPNLCFFCENLNKQENVERTFIIPSYVYSIKRKIIEDMACEIKDVYDRLPQKHSSK